MEIQCSQNALEWALKSHLCVAYTRHGAGDVSLVVPRLPKLPRKPGAGQQRAGKVWDH